jgi:hypothetical protein
MTNEGDDQDAHGDASTPRLLTTQKVLIILEEPDLRFIPRSSLLPSRALDGCTLPSYSSAVGLGARRARLRETLLDDVPTRILTTNLNLGLRMKNNKGLE